MRQFPLPVWLFAFAAWVAGEIVAYDAVSDVTGGGFALFLFILKPVVGALFVTRIVRQKLFAMLRSGGGVILEGEAAREAGLKGLGGALLVLPGFLAGVIGLALLTPGVRRLLLRWRAPPPQNPRDIDLSAEDWRELPESGGKRLRGNPFDQRS